MLEYDNVDLTINPTQVFSVHNWALKPKQTERPPFTDHIKAICNLDVPVDSKTPKPFSHTKEVPQGKKPGAKSGLRRKQFSKHTSESKTKVSKSKTGQSEKETQSSSILHLPKPSFTYKQCFFHLNSEFAPGYDASTDSTTKVDPGLSALNDSITSQQGTNEDFRADEISKKIKLEDLSNLLKDTRSAFFTPDSPQDEPIIVLDESEEEEVSKDKDTHESSHDVPKDTSTPHPPSPKSAQIQDLMAQPELSKLLASHNFSSFLPTKPKELPSKFTKLFGEIKELKHHVKDMEIKLPRDLKEIPTKLEYFTSTIPSLTSQKQLKTLDSLPSLLNKVTETLNRFSTVVENASGLQPRMFLQQAKIILYMERIKSLLKYMNKNELGKDIRYHIKDQLMSPYDSSHTDSAVFQDLPGSRHAM
ncbi:hypothetical protein Tco_1320049, partial [Tanacetum coccineum]